LPEKKRNFPHHFSTHYEFCVIQIDLSTELWDFLYFFVIRAKYEFCRGKKLVSMKKTATFNQAEPAASAKVKPEIFY